MHRPAGHRTSTNSRSSIANGGSTTTPTPSPRPQASNVLGRHVAGFFSTRSPGLKLFFFSYSVIAPWKPTSAEKTSHNALFRQQARNGFQLAALWAVIQDSQAVGFYGLPTAKEKLITWLPSGEVFTSRWPFRLGVGVGWSHAKTSRREEKQVP